MSRLRAALTNSTTLRTKLCRAVVKGAAGLAFLAVVGGQAQADTLVSGYVIAETWTATGSPYRLVGDVFVLGLTIESNVTVQAEGNYEFEVAGQLQVKGTATAPVLFTPGTTNGWKGILFRDAVPGSFFNHAIIEGANQSGVRITNTPPMFTNCVVRNNTTQLDGAGICAQVSSLALVIQGCSISNNLAGPYCSGSRLGGGIWVGGSSMILQCTIVNNATRGYDGYGGGVCLYGDCIMRNCTITGNIAGGCRYNNGDGVSVHVGKLQIFNCMVATNGLPTAGGYAGGLQVWNAANASAVNCVFAGNTLYGVENYGSGTVSLLNCTIAGNGSYGIVLFGGSVRATNCIVYFNNTSGVQLSGSMTLDYCNVQGGVQPGTGNISFSPALCPQNYSLVLGSPSIDAGNPAAVFNDVCLEATLCTPFSRGTSRNDMGAFGGPGACFGVGRGTPGDPPRIITQPKSQSSCLSQSISFSTGATGSQPLTYQWYMNGGLLSGRTESSLILTNLQSTNAGAYTVVVANNYGSVTSDPAQLVVNDACVDLCMYAGLNIAGLPGRTYELRYTTDLNNTNFATWTFLATNTTPWFYIDTNSCGVPKRFYGVKLRP